MFTVNIIAGDVNYYTKKLQKQIVKLLSAF